MPKRNCSGVAPETGFLSRRARSWRHERWLRRQEPCPHEKNPVSERPAEQLPHINDTQAMRARAIRVFVASFVDGSQPCPAPSNTSTPKSTTWRTCGWPGAGRGAGANARLLNPTTYSPTKAAPRTTPPLPSQSPQSPNHLVTLSPSHPLTPFDTRSLPVLKLRRF